MKLFSSACKNILVFREAPFKDTSSSDTDFEDSLVFDLSSSLLASGMAVDMMSVRGLLCRQAADLCFGRKFLDGDPNCPCLNIRRLAKIFGEPLKSRIGIVDFGVGLRSAELVLLTFNISTADCF